MKTFDRILSGKELIEMGFRKDSDGYLIGNNFRYGVYFPFRTNNIFRIEKYNNQSTLK